MNINKCISSFLFNFFILNKKLEKNKVYPYNLSLEYPYSNLFLSVSHLTLLHDKLNFIKIKPKKKFSLWGILKKIDEKKFKNELFYISSALYNLFLTGNLSILERHQSSFDFFSTVNFPFPLGSEAEIIYKKYDLQVKNPYNFSIYLRMEFTSSLIVLTLSSEKEIISQKITFKCTSYKNRKDIFTRINNRTIAVSSYKNK